MVFSVVKTDIVNASTDAIVLPANTQLKEGSGVSTAIFKAAGRRRLAKDCQKLAPCNVGSAVPTLAYDLDAKYIIHAVVPRWIDGEHDEYGLLSSAYLAALNVADIMECESIAFPLLSAGNNGYDPQLAFQIARESIALFSGDNIKEVLLVVYDDSVATMVKEQGYDVPDLPVNINKLKEKQKQLAKRKQMAADGKEVALGFVQKGLEYLKDDDNQNALLEAGVAIVKKVKAIGTL